MEALYNVVSPSVLFGLLGVGAFNVYVHENYDILVNNGKIEETDPEKRMRGSVGDSFLAVNVVGLVLALAHLVWSSIRWYRGGFQKIYNYVLLLALILALVASGLGLGVSMEKTKNVVDNINDSRLHTDMSVPMIVFNSLMIGAVGVLFMNNMNKIVGTEEGGNSRKFSFGY